MKKHVLDLDHLQVDPFETTGPAHGLRLDSDPYTMTECVGSYTAPYRYCLRQLDTVSDPCIP
jgi:hypothetical protein